MADPTASSSRFPPRSEPPATDDVDSGWLSDDEKAAVKGRTAESVAAVSADLPRTSATPDSRAPSAKPAFGDEALSSMRAPRASVRSRRGAPSWVLVALLLVAVTGLWVAFQRGNPMPVASQHGAESPATPALPGAAPADREPTRVVDPPIAGERVPAVEPVPAVANAPPATPEVGAPSAAVAAPDVPAPAVSTQVSVTVLVVPPEARLFHKGKPVGSSGVVLTLEPGERRTYEVGSPGFATRKLVIDGKSPAVRVTLRPSRKGGP